MSENEQSSTRSGDWLTVSQAAAALGKSERTTRRMCERGELTATVEANQSGGRAWLIARVSVERAATGQRDRADVRPNDAATKETTARPHFKRENSERPQNDAANVAAMLLREKDARIDDLRAQVESQKLQIEAANRQAAEATAALREYLKMQAKALPDGQSSTRNDAETSRDVGIEAPINAAMGKVSQDAKNAAQSKARREMRPLWKVILGVR